MFKVTYGNYKDVGFWQEEVVEGTCIVDGVDWYEFDEYDFVRVEEFKDWQQLALKALDIYLHCKKNKQDPTKTLEAVMLEIMGE